MKFRDGSQYVTTQRTSKQIKLAVVIAYLMIWISTTVILVRWINNDGTIVPVETNWIWVGLAGFALLAVATIQRWWNHE